MVFNELQRVLKLEYPQRLKYAHSVYEVRRIRAKERKDLFNKGMLGVQYTVLVPKGVKHNSVWVPMPWETASCCRTLKPPAVQYPWVYYKHCCSIRHIANLLEVDEKELVRQLVERPKATNCIQCGKFGVPENDYLCKQCQDQSSV